MKNIKRNTALPEKGEQLYKIEKNIPVAPTAGKGREGRKCALRLVMEKMQPGDSVLTDYKYAALYKIARQTFGSGSAKIRKEGSGLRIWRLL